jgi:glutamate---methylamine ligase
MEGGRFELRLADGAVNPCAMPAAILAAGLDGIQNNRDPGKRLDINMSTEGHPINDVKRLPLNLLDTLREASTLLTDSLGEYVPAY